MATTPQSKKIGQGCGCALVLIVVAAVIGGLLDPPKPASDEEMAAYVCGDFVKQSLRDPDSADFITDPSRARAIRQTDGSFTALLRVRAANGFGGKTVSLFSCTVTKDADGNWHRQNVSELGQD